MAISQNMQVVFVTKANSFHSGLGAIQHGKILIGDKAFEFYNDKNPEDYIQIPWAEISLVRAQMFFGDRYIRGFYVDTKNDGTFNFVVSKAGKTLKTMRDYIDPNIIVRQPRFSLKKLFKC